jgi:hypothetical protein
MKGEDMEIRVDEKQVQDAVNENINKAVGNAISSYDVQKTISDQISSEITVGVLAESICSAVKHIDTDYLTKAISSEIQKTMVSAVQHIIVEGIAGVLVGLRKIPDYDRDATKKAHMEIITMLKQENRRGERT